MSTLRHWYENSLTTLGETGAEVSTVKLLTVGDGQVWQVWQAPFPTEWPDAAELQLRELKKEWPAQPHQVRFIAECDGQILSVWPVTVQGESKQALSAEVSQQKALAEAAAAQSRTTQTILEASNVQINMLLATLETMGKRQEKLVDAIQRREESTGLSEEFQARAMTLLEAVAPPLLARVAQHYSKGK